MNPASIVEFLNSAGLLGAAVLLILALYTERLYLPSYVRKTEAQNTELREKVKELERDRDDWRDIAHSQAEVGERAVSVISRRSTKG